MLFTTSFTIRFGYYASKSSLFAEGSSIYHQGVTLLIPLNIYIIVSNHKIFSVDEEGRYEGRNPSPPPSHLDPEDMES